VNDCTLLRAATGIAVAIALTIRATWAAEPPRPDVIFVIADDLGWADVGFHGGSAPTPHLDAVARTGLELAQHVVAPVCSPTRTALLSGRCWSRFGVVDPQNERAFPWDTLTLPRALRAAGYETCLTGKWHLGSRPEESPNQFGFQSSYGSLAGGVTPFSHRYKHGPFTHTWHRDGKLLTETGHVTDLIAAEAVRWIESHTRKDPRRPPYLLYVPFTAPHLPIREPDEWLARVPKGIAGEVPRHYAACVMHLDDAVGRILRAVDEAGTRDRTLFVFTSDNGGSTSANTGQDYPDDGCPAGDVPGDNRPFRGAKGDLYEGGVRVPTVVSWPGHVKPGRVEAAVQVADWMPTICRLAGFTPDRDPRWDGTDIGPLLAQHEPPAERPIYAVGTAWRARSLRLGQWKLIVTAGRDGGPEQVELFDLVADPAEATNLAANRPEDLARLHVALDAAAARDRDAVP
jgi:arylsulfatase A-like enzyme